nr:hypothetical protein [Tanacetum cinerariifolium]
GRKRASEEEWRGGSDRSGDEKTFWFRQKNLAGKVFRRRLPAASGGGRPVGLPPVGSGRE